MKPQYILFGTAIIVGALVWCEIASPVTIMFAATIGILLILYGTIYFLGAKSLSRGVLDFLIGDEGSLSLSRLQAVLWGVVILSSQVAVMLALALNKNEDVGLREYELVFSESAIWLLALSMTSYLSVKGISVNRISQQPQLYKKKRPKVSDLIMGNNGLDFSKCQMLVWTVLAVIVFFGNVDYFLEGMLNGDNAKSVHELFQNEYEEYAKLSPSELLESKKQPPYVPYLPWSFVVLMGLSQGAYVGKKLVPTFKLDDFKDARQADLETVAKKLNVKKDLLNKMLNAHTGRAHLTALDIQNKNILVQEIHMLESGLTRIGKDIHDIEIYKGARP